KEELLKNEFELDLILAELERIDKNVVEEKLKKLISKKLNSNHKYSQNYLKQKITEQMTMLGFSKEMVNRQLEKEEVNHTDILEHEARKLYQKYKNKKSGNELYLFLKQKLYQKRYPLDEISLVLDNILSEVE
ncbi:MAG: hypothetical protein HFH31_02785, partial [Bacilli bacterium]|nr:hypothetical protein [Bacilli bacterium]